MSAFETFRTALSALAANKLRSSLTVLGLCIGVAAVIALVAVGNGSKQQVEASINALGSNVLVVQTQPGGFGPGSQRRRGEPLDQGCVGTGGRVQRARREVGEPGRQRVRHDADRGGDELRAVLVRRHDAVLSHHA